MDSYRGFFLKEKLLHREILFPYSWVFKATDACSIYSRCTCSKYVRSTGVGAVLQYFEVGTSTSTVCTSVPLPTFF